MLEHIKEYNISINKDKELFLSLPVLPGDANLVDVVYDGSDHALLKKLDKTYLLEYVTDEFKRLAPRLVKCYAAEFKGDMENFDNMQRAYEVNIDIVEKLPVSEPLPRAKEDIMAELESAVKDGTIDETIDRLIEELGL